MRGSFFVKATLPKKRGNMGPISGITVATLFYCCCGHSNLFALGAVMEKYQNESLTDLNSSTDFVSFQHDCDENISSFDSAVWLGIVRESDLKISKVYTVLVILAYVLVFVKGIIGNTLVILVISVKPHMRTVTNLFILNLAVADMFVLICCLPATLLANILHPWVLGSFMCRGVTYIQAVSVMASAYSLVAISIDRCKAICQHSMSTRGFSKNQALKIICLIWVYAILLPLPWLFVFELRESSDGVPYCQEIWGDETVGLAYFLVANLFCCYVLPFLLITVASLIIWWKVSHRRVPHETEPASPACMHVKRIHLKTKRGVRKMLVVVSFTFLLCWLPLYILATYIELSSYFTELERTILSVVVPLAQWLAYWNSCVNPVIYAFYNANFRKTAKSLLPACLVEKCFPVSDAQEHGMPVALTVFRYNSSRLKRNTAVSSSTSYTLNDNSLNSSLRSHRNSRRAKLKQNILIEQTQRVSGAKSRLRSCDTITAV